jgi:hypothetical protein
MALARLGDRSQRVTSIFPATTTIEQWCADVYEPTLVMAISRLDWPCFRKLFALSVSSEDPALTGWSYKYTRPADCLVFRRVVDANENSYDFKEMTEWSGGENTAYIYTNIEDAYGVYSYNNQDANSYSPGFVWLHSAMIAQVLAMPLTGKPQIAEALQMQILRFIEREAKAAGGLEHYIEDEKGTDDWLDAIETGLST